MLLSMISRRTPSSVEDSAMEFLISRMEKSSCWAIFCSSRWKDVKPSKPMALQKPVTLPTLTPARSLSSLMERYDRSR